ncbi:MAG: shikimate kinase [Muribaculaceae bacterium]|nr:shikimate kinase [Muribaculaceae bacterium]
MMTIFIIGYMASGKTTFGRALARQTGLQHIDLDFYIEQRFHSTVRDIFANKGEDEFRRIEGEMLREVGEMEDTIISCGGGTPCFGDNIDYMNSRGLTVCLQASDDTIADRIIQAGDKRPLMAGKSRDEIIRTLREHMEQRRPYYDRAQLLISGDRLENRRQIAETVADFIKNHLNNLEERE